jgi:xylono-1,5-lactonase
MIGPVEVALRAGAELGEGPLWDAEREALWWVDLLGGTINCLQYRTLTNTVVEAGETVSALALRRGETSLLVALQSGFGIVDPIAGSVSRVMSVDEGKPNNRFNDGKVDSQGRFWAGTMDFDSLAGRGALYRLSPDWKCEGVLSGVGCSNGLDWSPDDTLMYYVDTPTQRVDEFEFDAETGKLGQRRPFVTIPETDGRPDGLAVDAEGSVWLAVFGASAVYRFDRQGRRTGSIDLPVLSVTSCAFGGPDLRDLFITTAAAGFDYGPLDGQPLAGAIFRVEVDTPGQAPNRFAA